MKNLILLLAAMAALSSCDVMKPLQEVPYAPVVKDSIVYRERVVTDTIILPDHYVEYIDTTECPPSAEPVIITQERRVTLPGKTVYLDRIHTDTVTIRTNLTRENELIREANERTRKLNELSAKHKTLQRKHRLQAFALWPALALLILAAILLIRRRATRV